MTDNTQAQDAAKAAEAAKQGRKELEKALAAELAKPGRYIVDGNVVDPNGKVICSATVEG